MPFSLEEKAAFQYWAQLDCPVSLALTILGRAGDWSAVLTFKVEPENFVDPYDYSRANAAVCFLKKNPHVSGATSDDRRRKCEDSFRDGEASCYRANERLAPYLMHPLEDSMHAKLLRVARRHLLTWLGPCPDDVPDPVERRQALDLGYRPRKYLTDLARHGPGTTFSSRLPSPTAADKYYDSLTLTHGAVFYLWNIAGTMWSQSLSAFPKSQISFSRGNRFTTVPKTALTDRGIGIECSLNIYFQLALGSAIRSSLRRRVGVDLNTVSDVHREMARQSSVDGMFATIDLTNASDSLCKNLVRILLRDTPWLERMEDLRSTHTFFSKKWHLLEKFSSMGNGYTFELETCVFACIIAATLELTGNSCVFGHDFHVFGDDLIVRTESAKDVVAALAWVGFRVNKEKTFLHGSFRESCGGDYFLGYPVRGYYFKDQLNYGTQSIYALFNGAKTCLENSGVLSPWFLDWLRHHHLPVALRSVGGPRRLGDTVLHGVEPTYRWRRGIRWVKVVTWHKPVTHKWGHWPAMIRLACRLTGYGSHQGITSRGRLPCQEFDWVSGS